MGIPGAPLYETAEDFEAKCEEMGSNVSVEIRRFIYEFLKNK